MKQFRALNFEKFRRGKGGMNFCLGRGCLVNLRSANYLVNGCGRKLFGNGDLEDVCGGDTYCWGDPLCGLVEQSSSSNS